MHKIDLRILVTIAFLIFAGTSYWFSTFDSSASFATLIWPRFVMGLAIPCFFIPLNQIYLSGLPGAEIASASGLSNFFRTLGSSVSTAVMVTLWQHRGIYHHASLTEYVNNGAPASETFLHKLSHIGLSATQQLGYINQIIDREGYTLAVNDVFYGCAILFILLLPVLWFARPPFGSAGGGMGH
jgi:MFS transporter, DHA2 family, multidrug resistance protein